MNQTLHQYEMQDPLKQYPQPKFEEQPQSAPGLAQDMVPKPDHGELTYEGFGRLAGRRALITGADSGIGRAVAIAFAREGADIALNYLPSEQTDADEVVSLVEKAGRKAVALPGDISSEAFCNDLVAEGTIGLGRHRHSRERRRETNERRLRLRISRRNNSNSRSGRTSTRCSGFARRHFPHMPPGGTIVNTTSIQSYQPSPGLLDYASTKAAITAFTHALAKQVADKGIRVNAVAPGPVWTPLQPSGGQPQDKIPDFGSEVPLKRPAQPAELAPVYVLLASQESSFVTGEIYGVTGGRHLP